MRLALRTGFILTGLAAIGLTAAGWGLGELMRLQPCPLCIFQRLIYLLLALIALLGAIVPRWHRVSGGLLAAAAAGGVATAAYQSWLQWQPDPSRECAFGEPGPIEQIVNWFAELWPAMFTATGFCSSKEWVFLGLSLANWSALCFLAFLATAGWLGTRSDER